MARKPKYLTVQEAAQASGLSEKALRRRVERGTLPSEIVGGRRMIPHSALVKAGHIGGPSASAPADPEAIAQLRDAVDSLTRRMDALEVWVLRSLQEVKK